MEITKEIPEEFSEQDFGSPIDLETIDESYAEVLSAEESQDKTPDLVSEPLFSHLLRGAVQKIWPNDQVMLDFVDYVVPSLSDLLGHETAKGGDFVLKQLEQGIDVSRYAHDQSMRAHLINGIFPVLHIADTLREWSVSRFQLYDDDVRRTFIAGYILHDWLKLPEVEDTLHAHGLEHDSVNPAQHRNIVEVCFRQWSVQLGFEQFLKPLGGIESCLHDLIYVACNTQIKWGTLRNMASLPKLNLHDRQLGLAEDLSRLADYLTYLGRDPRQLVSNHSIHREISILSDQSACFAFHHIADVRGVLTNLIQNAVLAATTCQERCPILYAPSGVVYLCNLNTTSFPSANQVAEAVVDKVKQTASRRLSTSLTGFGRANIGLKYADYYKLFFAPIDMVSVGVNAAFKIIHEGKKPASGKRFAKMIAGNWLDDLTRVEELKDDIRIDQLAEWSYFAEKIARELPGDIDVPKFLIDTMGLTHIYDDFLAVPRDTRAGGVGYHWYFAAGHYLEQNPGLDPQGWREDVESIASKLNEHLRKTQETHSYNQETSVVEDDGFADLRNYVRTSISFGLSGRQQATLATKSDVDDDPDFGAELHRYSNAKKRGRGTTAMCTLCSSPYSVAKQQESAILFAPQVYSNKANLHGTNALRDICSICGLESMLRQLLMNRTGATGGRFEGRNVRYLYFYPTYFFTPETMEIFGQIYRRLQRIKFTELRNSLVQEIDGQPQLNFEPHHWQRIEPVMMTSREEFNPDEDRYMRLHFPEDEPITFYFLGVPPPGRDSKDAEAWVHPAFLSFLLPLCIDVKVVASESSLPLLNEANEMAETVLLDGVHAAIGYITEKERLNLDQVLPTLKRLVTGYLIHIDGNSEAGGKDFYRWQSLPAVARNLSESSLYAFHYLKKWQRRTKLDGIPTAKARLYLMYEQILSNGGNNEMNHAKELTRLYRRFYRATRDSQGRLRSNAVLKPIAEVSKILTTPDLRVLGSDGLMDAVRGELMKFVERVGGKRADGFIPGERVDGKWVVDNDDVNAAIDEFSNYFITKILNDSLNGDISALRGKRLNLLKNACDVIYRDMEAAERAAKKNSDTITIVE